MPEPIQAKSPEEIVKSFDALMVKGTELRRRGVYNGTDEFAENQWLRASMASLLVWASEEARPEECKLLDDWGLGVNRGIEEYEIKLVALANSLTKKE